MTTETFAGTLPAIIRTSDHRYIYETVEYPGVTTALRVLDKPALMTWAAKQTAEAALALIPEGDGQVTTLDGIVHGRPTIDPEPLVNLIKAVGREGTIAALTARKNWTRDEAAALGSAVHAWADDMTNGRPLPDLSPLALSYARQYAEWWKSSGWTLRLSEAVVVAPAVPGAHEGWGGTFDLLARDADGRTVLADIKTGSGVYRETILQLAAYGMAPIVSPMGSQAVYPMVVPDRYCVIHVTADKVREVEVNVSSADQMAWLSVLDLYRWTQRTKGRL